MAGVQVLTAFGHYSLGSRLSSIRDTVLMQRVPGHADMLIDNSKDLVKIFTRNERDQIRMAVPYVFFFIAGFMCCDKCPNNVNRVALKGSMQRGEGKTADTFEDAKAYIRRMRPAMVALENLKEFITPVIDGAHLSDAIFIIQSLTNAGYAIVTAIISKAKKVGRRPLPYTSIQCGIIGLGFWGHRFECGGFEFGFYRYKSIYMCIYIYIYIYTQINASLYIYQCT